MSQVSPFGGRFDPRSALQLTRQSMDEGKRLSFLQGSKALLYWNFLNLFLVLTPMMLPAMDLVASNLRYIMFNAVICTVFTWWRLGVPTRLIWPIRFVLALQIWLTLTSFISGSQLGRTNDFETSNYFLIMAVIYYFNAGIISFVWHEYRRWFFNTILIAFFASCFVGFLQFLKVPPALALSGLYNANNDITAWGTNQMGVIVHGAGSVRAIGLASWPEWLAFQGMTGWAILASRLLKRGLKPWEFILATFFLLTAFTAQSRIMYLSLGVCTIAFVYMLVRRDRARGPLYLTVFLVGLLAMFSIFGDRLSYILDTNIGQDKTLQYRTEIGWQQAFRIIEERPWVGIGPDDGLVWSVKQIVPDRWTQGQYVDNGFLLLLSWGGLPALALYLPIIVIGLGSAFLIARNDKLSQDRRQAAFVGGVMVGMVLNNMMLNNGFTNIWMNCIIACVAALALPNSAERLKEMKHQYHIHRGRKPLEAKYAEIPD